MSQKSRASLDEKSIRKIAAQVEQNMRTRGGSDASDAGNKRSSGRTSKGGFLWGAVSGIAVAAAAPLFSKQLRPAVRGAIKGGIATGRYVQKISQGVREDLQDLTAEAKADLDKDSPETTTA
jgi:sensor domain CHASE-containing protein